MIDEINKISENNFHDKDLIGRVYEYFLSIFSIYEGKAGEYYTPKPIVENIDMPHKNSLLELIIIAEAITNAARIIPITILLLDLSISTVIVFISLSISFMLLSTSFACAIILVTFSGNDENIALNLRKFSLLLLTMS